jgi:hypothetical protein
MSCVFFNDKSISSIATHKKTRALLLFLTKRHVFVLVANKSNGVHLCFFFGFVLNMFEYFSFCVVCSQRLFFSVISLSAVATLLVHRLLHGLLWDGLLLLLLDSWLNLRRGDIEVLSETLHWVSIEVHNFLLWLVDLDDIRLLDLDTGTSSWVVWHHNAYLNTEHTLLELEGASSSVDVRLGGLTRLDHVSITELHGLGTLTTQLTGHDELTTLGSVLHNVTKDTVACLADGETSQKLVAEGLGLSNSTGGAVLDARYVQFHIVWREVETLLDQSGKLTDALVLLTKDVLGTSSQNDDLSAHRGYANLDTRVTILT